jgi:hypothetical protein
MITLRKRLAFRGRSRALLPALLFLVLAMLAAVTSAGEARRVEGLSFDEIDVNGAVTVEVSAGDEPGLQLLGDAEDLDREPFYVDGRRLVLGRSTEYRRHDFSDVKFRVEVPELRALRLRGTGTVYLKEMRLADGADTVAVILDGSGDMRLYGIEAPALDVRIKGSGDIKAVYVSVKALEAVVSGSGDLYFQRLDARSAELVVTGSGDIKVTDDGFVHSLEANVVGSGDISMRRVDCDTAEVAVVGSGTVDLGEVREAIDATILGSGDVRFDGDPDVEGVELGSGEVRRRD